MDGPADHVSKRVVLLHDFDGRRIRNFRILGDLNPI